MEQETQIHNEKIQLIQAVISSALGAIDQPREREIINRRFGLGVRKETLEQIGERLDITRERVRQLEKAALIRLKIAAEKGNVEHLAEIEKSIIRNLAEVGRISKTKNLVEKIIESEATEEQIFNFLFIAEISSKLVLVQENDKYHSAIANAEYGDERKIKKSIYEIVNIIKKNKSPINLDQLDEQSQAFQKHLQLLTGFGGLKNGQPLTLKIFAIKFS